MKFRSVLTGVGLLLAGFSGIQAQSSFSDSLSPVPPRVLLDRYCVTCHNNALKTAGLMLDQANVDDVSNNPQLWERVVTKLSLHAMPPVGLPRPDESDYEAFHAYLRTELDQLAQENLNPGRPPIRRLNRTEYANAIRDLLNLEIDVEALLPPDTSRGGFDNNAEALMISPLLMERYIFAAGRISRLAVGAESMAPVSETYQVSDEFLQTARMSEDLPFDSRGGTTFQHYFPLDGDYTVSVKLQRNQQGFIRGLREEHTLDIRLDHLRMGTFKIGGEIHGRSGPIFSDMDKIYAGDSEQAGYEYTADKELEIRFPAKAGTHLVGVTFLDNRKKPTGIQLPQMSLVDIQYFKGGKPAVASVTITGPYNARGPGTTTSREQIFMCHPLPSATFEQKEACARTILSRLARRAYRRPVTSEDMTPLLSFYRAGQREDGFEGGIETALQRILTGPKFLFRIERDPPGAVPGEVYPVSDLELASRLSFFLWSTIPDEQLLKVAEQARLREPGVLEGQVRRMVTDPRFEAFIDNFGGQWLNVRGVDIADPILDIFPNFDGELRQAFKEEMKRWFASLVREDRSVVELLTSDYTYLNERLARHYGIPGVNSSHYRRVLVNRPERRGLLGKGALLLVTAYGNRTSPVLRGKWVLSNLLAMPPAPPPDNVPALKTDDEGGQALTLKQAMERHRANPVCASCHKLMDPIGFALEQFDGIGAFRTHYSEAEAEVDATGVLFDGSAFRDTEGFQQAMLKHTGRVVHTVAEKLLSYGVGRGIEYYDQPAVRDIVRQAADEDYSWSSLILGVVESTPFQYRRVQP